MLKDLGCFLDEDLPSIETEISFWNQKDLNFQATINLAVSEDQLQTVQEVANIKEMEATI